MPCSNPCTHDSCSIDLDVIDDGTGKGIVANLNMDPASVLSCGPDGVRVDLLSTDCIDLAVIGGALAASPIISPDSQQALECRPDGLFVPRGGIISSDCLEVVPNGDQVMLVPKFQESSALYCSAAGLGQISPAIHATPSLAVALPDGVETEIPCQNFSGNGVGFLHGDNVGITIDIGGLYLVGVAVGTKPEAQGGAPGLAFISARLYHNGTRRLSANVRVEDNEAETSELTDLHGGNFNTTPHASRWLALSGGDNLRLKSLAISQPAATQESVASGEDHVVMLWAVFLGQTAIA
jgi:hypothetical protein